MTRSAIELCCLGCVVAGFYQAWPPLGFIVGGAIGLAWLVLTGDRFNADSNG